MIRCDHDAELVDTFALCRATAAPEMRSTQHTTPLKVARMYSSVPHIFDKLDSDVTRYHGGLAANATSVRC